MAVLRVAKDAVSQISLDQVVLEVFERAAYLGRQRLKKALVLLVVEVGGVIIMPLSIGYHELTYICVLQQVEEARFELEELLQLRLGDKTL